MHCPQEYVEANGCERESVKTFLESLRPLCQFVSNERVLDVGCGPGDSTATCLRDLLPNDARIVGCDISEEMVEYARTHYGNERLEFKLMDIASPNIWSHWKREEFDKIFSFFCLHWTQNLSQVIYNIGELVKPNGLVVLLLLGWTPLNMFYEFQRINPKWVAQSVMLHNVTILAATKQLYGEGLFYLYRGVLPPLCQKSVSVSLMFGVYDECRRPLLERNVNPILAKIASSIAAGTVESVLVPFERIQTLLQHEKYQKEFANMKHSIVLLWKHHGPSEFYRGLVPILFRNGPSNAVFFLLRDSAKEKFPEPSAAVSKTIHRFAVGALIGALCSTIFYPCNVLKVHMQSRVGGPFQSIREGVLEIYKERGSVHSFFRGIHLNYTRSCISWGVINVSYELLKGLL